MVTKKEDSEKKSIKMSIIAKMLINTFFFTIIPLVITGLLIIYSYQYLINSLLTEKGVEFSQEIIKSLFLALQNAQIQAFLTLFIVIILTLFSNVLISRNLTQPLKKLVKGTKEVAKGNLDFKIESSSSDELGELSVQFNNMIQQLKESKVLEEAKTTLEIKVKARTKELEILTKSLEEQVQQRTKELQEKVGELEKFQRFSVGRELKMVELKSEIEKLKSKLQEEEPKKIESEENL